MSGFFNILLARRSTALRHDRITALSPAQRGPPVAAILDHVEFLTFLWEGSAWC
jgi:hypothetical protein